MYREQGYLPAAFRNYLALLGWSPGDEEIVPLEVILERFRLEDVQRSPAFFDIQKLSHMNGVYIRELLGRRLRGGGAPVGRPRAGGVGSRAAGSTRTPARRPCRLRPGRRSASTPGSSPRWPR